MWTGLIWLRIKTGGELDSYGEVESSCEFGIEPTGSKKCWETIEWPNI
jgi:hypothetical protein